MTTIPPKITFGEMRASGVRRVLAQCRDQRCRHPRIVNGDTWRDEVRLADVGPTFRCTACGKRGADIRPAD